MKHNAMSIAAPDVREVRVFHMFGAIGGGAKGFNRGSARVGNMVAKFRCIGSVDVDQAANRDFQRLVGVPATDLDLFDRDQYKAFHGKEPPQGWREAMPDDIRRAAGGEFPNIVFLSAPCKGFSGLLAENKSRTEKYQALNRLTERGIWLMLEAFKDNLPELVVFENVPRILARGRPLLDRIKALLQHYGFAVAETTHDCGELGGLAQSRKRFLLVARHMEKVPPFLYEPPKRRLQAVGTVLGRMPLPGDLRGGPMHRIPSLQWKTWVRLAFVEAGGDWRSLNKLAIENGHLRDFLIVPEMHNGTMGVVPWTEPMGTITGNSRPMTGTFTVADPRQELYSAGYGVNLWSAPTGTIGGESLPSNGRFAVADPRHPENAPQYQQFGVLQWDKPAGTIIGVKSPGQGNYSVADPRVEVKHNNCFRVVHFDRAAGTVTGGGHPSSGGQAVADPRTGYGDSTHHNVLHVTDWESNSKTITGGSHPAGGGQCVADPRPNWHRHSNALQVNDWEQPTSTVIGGGKGVQGGWMSVADPRPNMQREKGDNYLTGGHYGVVPWEAATGAVSASACHDNGTWSVADPRLPEASDKLVCVIRSMDGTWHRPFTTLELAAIQSLIEPEEYLELDGLSDQAWRERIGNAVPPAAAEAIANVMGTTLLLAWSGETFLLSSTPIWVQPVAAALSVAQGNQEAA